MTDERRPMTGGDRPTELPADDDIEITGIEAVPADAPPPSATDEPGQPWDDDEDLQAPPRRAADADVDAGELERLREDLLRVRADFENFRKRQDRERGELRRLAAAGLVEKLLPVLDNFKRAMAVDGGDDAAAAFRQGIELIYRQLMEVMETEGLAPVPTEGEPFDPNVHEAVAREETDAVAAHTVVAELEPGYLFRERLLKPARVRVAVPPSES